MTGAATVILKPALPLPASAVAYLQMCECARVPSSLPWMW